MANIVMLKRDQHGKNRFQELSEFYQRCQEKFDNNYKAFEQYMNNSIDKKLINRHDDFMKQFKSPKTSIMRIIESSESVSKLLYESKIEHEKDRNELYFFHSFYILHFFNVSIKQSEINNEKKYKRDITQYIIFITFIKNAGHTLAYDLFLGWAVYQSQIFQIPHQNIKPDDIPLLLEAGKSRNVYFELIKYTTYILACLICINPINLAQFIRHLSGQEESYKDIQKSYKNIINLDIEQQDYYWHFVDMFFKQSYQYFNHTTIIMMSNFMELSYIQMKTAAEQFDQISSQLVKSTLQVQQQQFHQLFSLVISLIIPKLENKLKKIADNSEIDSFTRQILQPGVTAQILSLILKKLKDRMNRYSNKTLFQNEKADQNQDEQQEKEDKVIDNPFYFLKIKD